MRKAAVLVSLALVLLCLYAGPVSAEYQVLFPGDPYGDSLSVKDGWSIADIAGDGERLYAVLTWLDNMRLYTCSPEDAEPVLLLEQAIPAGSMYTTPVFLISGKAQVWAVECDTGRLGTLGPAGIIWGTVTLELPELLTPDESGTVVTYHHPVGKFVRDDRLYLMLAGAYDDEMVRHNPLVAYDLDTGERVLSTTLEDVKRIAPYSPGKLLLLKGEMIDGYYHYSLYELNLAEGIQTPLIQPFSAKGGNPQALAYDPDTGNIFLEDTIRDGDTIIYRGTVDEAAEVWCPLDHDAWVGNDSEGILLRDGKIYAVQTSFGIYLFDTEAP